MALKYIYIRALYFFFQVSCENTKQHICSRLSGKCKEWVHLSLDQCTRTKYLQSHLWDTSIQILCLFYIHVYVLYIFMLLRNTCALSYLKHIKYILLSHFNFCKGSKGYNYILDLAPFMVNIEFSVQGCWNQYIVDIYIYFLSISSEKNEAHSSSTCIARESGWLLSQVCVYIWS